MNLNVGIQIQLWRVTTFHKIHCVIYYTIVVIDYQWTILKKKLRVITLNMVFSKVTTLPMVSLTRHEEFIKAWLWHTFKTYIYDILPNNYFSQSFSNHCLLLFLCQKAFYTLCSKLCFSTSGNSTENKSVLSFHPFPLLPKDSKD